LDIRYTIDVATATRTLAFSGLLLVSLAAGCSGNPNQPESIPLGQSFDLRSAAIATVEGGLAVSFDRVVSDGRCGIDAICVWEGDAVLAISLSSVGGSPASYEIHTQPLQSEVKHGSFLVKLTALSPYPISSRPTNPEDFVATFKVTSQ
jgi:hypothetical protein